MTPFPKAILAFVNSKVTLDSRWIQAFIAAVENGMHKWMPFIEDM